MKAENKQLVERFVGVPYEIPADFQLFHSKQADFILNSAAYSIAAFTLIRRSQNQFNTKEHTNKKATGPNRVRLLDSIEYIRGDYFGQKVHRYR